MESVHLKGLVQWLERFPPDSVRDLDELMIAIAREIASIDNLVQDLLKRVLHHPKFQQIEASFRNIRNLFYATELPEVGITEELPPQRNVNIFVLDISAEELESDLAASSHLRTELFRKLFNQRFDLLIGDQNFEIEGYAAIHPFSLILADFEFCFPQADTKKNQLGLTSLQKLSRIGEHCFCMFLLGLSPKFFDVSFDHFGQLNQVIDLEKIIERDRYRAWRDFRLQDEARMIGLALPRIVVREPYFNLRFSNGISFSESDGQLKREEFLWGNGIFAVVQPIIRSFLNYDWFSDVCGVDRDYSQIVKSQDHEESRFDAGYDGGYIENLPTFCFKTDRQDIATHTATDFIVSEPDESIFSKLGFISLFSINNSSCVATLTSQTVQSSVEMTTRSATDSLRLSTLFNQMLNACRMAHRLKMLCRSQIGVSASAREFENFVHGELMKKTSNRGAQLNQRMLKPFSNDGTEFSAVEDVTDPGKYDCRIRLCPHHKFDNGKTKIIFEPISLDLELNSQEDS